MKQPVEQIKFITQLLYLNIQESESPRASALFSRMRFVRLLYQGLAALVRHEAQEGLK